jgi:hypothetical protein
LLPKDQITEIIIRRRNPNHLQTDHFLEQSGLGLNDSVFCTGLPPQLEQLDDAGKSAHFDFDWRQCPSDQSSLFISRTDPAAIVLDLVRCCKLTHETTEEQPRIRFGLNYGCAQSYYSHRFLASQFAQLNWDPLERNWYG